MMPVYKISIYVGIIVGSSKSESIEEFFIEKASVERLPMTSRSLQTISQMG